MCVVDIIDYTTQARALRISDRVCYTDGWCRHSAIVVAIVEGAHGAYISLKTLRMSGSYVASYGHIIYPESKMLEKDVKDKVKSIVQAAAKLVPLYTMCPMTFGYGESGHPDRLLYINGYLLGIECKKSAKTSLLNPKLKPTSSERAQKLRLRELSAAGGISIIVHAGNLQDFKALLEQIIGQKIKE